MRPWLKEAGIDAAILFAGFVLGAAMCPLSGCGDPPPDCRTTKCPSGQACVLGVQPKGVGYTIEGEKVYYCAAVRPLTTETGE